MTKKDYQLIADALKRAMLNITGYDPGEYCLTAYEQWRRDVDAIANACASTNSTFKRSKFYEACGVVTREEAKGIEVILGE